MIAAKGRPTGTQGVEHAAQAEQIAAIIDRMVLGLLRRHVGRGAQGDAAFGVAGIVDDAGQAEIGDLDRLGPLLHQQVAWLDVSMDDAALVGSNQATGRLQADFDHLRNGEPRSGIEALLQ